MGEVGAPTAKYINDYKNYIVYGYDLLEKKIPGVKTFTEWEKIPKCDIYVIIVSSIAVEDICKKITHVDKNVLTLIESTVRLGTCRGMSETYGLKNIVHCPHRYWSKDLVKHGVAQHRVIGAINKEGLQNALDFYASLDVELHICPSIEIAEMCKTAENSYRFVQIAFAEELKIICDSVNIDFEAVRVACNTKWNTEIMEARDGIGGHCLPKDIRYLQGLFYSPLIDGAIKTDQTYKKFASLAPEPETLEFTVVEVIPHKGAMAVHT